MSSKSKIIFISLAGVGGCSVSKALRGLGQHATPFDWLIARQDFVISSLESNGKYFFDFDDLNRLHGKTIITTPENNALSIHDIKKDWALEKEDVKQKYHRRWMRLNNVLNSRPAAQKIIFVRSWLDMDEPIESIYDNIFLRQKESIGVWEDFLDHLKKKYPLQEMDLVILTSRKDIHSDAPNVHVVTLKNYKDHKEIKKHMKKFLPLADRYHYLAVNLIYTLKKLHSDIVNRRFSKLKVQSERP